MDNDYIIVNSQGQILQRNLDWENLDYKFIDNPGPELRIESDSIKNAYIGNLNQCKLLIMNIAINPESVLIIEISGAVDPRQLYTKLINQNGINTQLIVAVEEMAELQKEICKILRTGDIDYKCLITEIADTEIMIDQIKFYYNLYSQVDKEIDYKLNRTNDRLERGLL